ncbi:MAG: hypothetical protein PHD56_14620 [Anaerostipes sp.]|nr:hypothetical protein [Anaerostipes sp.]
MDEYSRIVIERYCMSHKSKKSGRLQILLNMSYDFGAAYPTDDDAIFLEKAIRSEKDEELKEALQDLDSFLFG